MPRELESLVLSTLERKVMKHKEKRYAALEAGPERSLWEKKKNTEREIEHKVWHIFTLVSDCRKILSLLQDNENKINVDMNFQN